ncbi:plasmid replication protein, CyRepA1 family [[Scytonema hofmanni] UTEX B 1581]|uniref:plasmid replication protein, CyRepA1 family n=1 Tax=[Scytonema hofmanni] UTEX B 1581 TaxID=379535 RepID=UPI0011821103|nr:plasmid replication protein, CyRepA1 family [[Scytonema hofmanni] UTEX B 1581]
MSLTPTSTTRPCPICEDTKGNCRHHHEESNHLCMTFADTRFGEIINGYKCLAHFDLWAAFCLDNSQEWTQSQRENWLSEQTAKRQLVQKQRQDFLKGLLSVEERDRQYRTINDKLSLSKYHVHKALAKKRGLHENEIWFAYNRGWVRTWQPGLEIKDISPKLAGINPNNETLTGVRGIAIAATDGQGHIVGHQIAADDRDKYGKYIWLSSRGKGGNSPHLPNGELPLFVWRHPEATQISETWLVEGSLKSLIVALKVWLRENRTDIQVIGAAGANFKGSSETFKQAIAVQTTKTVKLFPDGGAIYNQQIVKNYKAAIDLAVSDGFDVSVGWWGQYEKARNDIDEIQNFGIINYISPSEFFGLADKSADSDQNNSQPTQQVNTDESEESSQLDSQPKQQANNWQWDKWLKSRKFTPDVVINQAEFSFDGIDIPQSDAIIAVKSGLGTGKTNALINEIKKANLNGFGTYIPGYRNNLLLQTTERALVNDVAMYHLHLDDEGHLMLLDKESNIVSCIDSFKKVDGHIKGRDIHIDETCSVFLYAVNGGTLGNEQATILRIFKKALAESNRIFLYDGNLADIYVDFVAKIAAKKHVIKIENRQKIPPHNIFFIEGIDEDGEIKKGDRSPLVKFLLRPEVKSWIFADSKERTKVLYKLLTESGKTGYVLNSETTSEGWAKEFLADPNKFVLNKKPDFIILSPTAESGISCTVNGYFTHKFSFYAGVLATNSQHQSTVRLRDNIIPHYIFCPEFSTIRDRSTPMTYSEKVMGEILKDRIMQSLMLASESAENPQSAKEIMIQALVRNDDDWWVFSLKLAALDQFEMNNYRKCFIHALREAGHNVTIEQWDTAIKVKEAESEARVEIQKQHAKEVFEAVEFNSIEEANKKAKASPNKATQRRIEKTRLLDRLPGINFSELWSDEFIYQCKIKNREFIRQQERFWLLSNYDTSQKRHESIWNHAALSEDFFSRRVSAMGHDAIWALRELKILDFTTRPLEYHKDSPEVISLVNTLRSRNDIQLALRISSFEPETVNGKERLRILSNLLDYIGYKTQFAQRKRIKTDNGVIQTRYYRIVPTGTPSACATPPPIVNKPEGYGTPPQATDCATPPPIVNKPEGYGTPPELVNNTPSSQFDLLAARQAILSCIEYKFTTWMQSDKSKVSWSVEEVAIAIQPEESAHNHVVDHTTEEWLQPENLTETANWLGACENAEMLGTVRAAVPAYALKEACKLLPKFKLIQIKQWVLHLNSLMVSIVEDTATQPSQQLVTDENLADTAALLQSCDNVEMLADLRACCFDFIIEKASELISPTLKQWVCSWLSYWRAEEKCKPNYSG